MALVRLIETGPHSALGDFNKTINIPAGEWNLEYIQFNMTDNGTDPRYGLVSISLLADGTVMPIIYNEPLSPAKPNAKAYPDVRVKYGDKITCIAPADGMIHDCIFMVLLSAVEKAEGWY